MIDDDFDKMLEELDLPDALDIAKATSEEKRKLLYYNNPTWIKQNNALAKTPGLASKISADAWNPQRKQEQSKRTAKMMQDTDQEWIDGRTTKLRNKICKAFVTPMGVFEGQIHFKQKTGLNPRDKAKLLPHLYYYEEDGPGEAKYERVYYTPYDYHNGIRLMWEMAKEAGCKYALKNKHAKEWFHTMKKKDPENYYVKKEIKREWLLQGKSAQ